MARRVAFLIGNQKFPPESGLPPLQGPANDIAALTRLLGDPDRGKFEVHEFPEKPRYEILPKIEQALSAAATEDLFLIFYSGHGKLARNGQLCLATADTQQDALRATSIPARHLTELVEESDCGQVILLLDCCYSGAVDAKGDVSSELRVVDNAQGFYIMTATTATKPARETELAPGGAVMGRFTAALVNGIESGAADQSRKGKILLSDLRHYLGRVATGSTPQFFALRASGDPLISLSPATAATPVEATMSAADALGEIGPNAAEATPALVAILKDPNQEVRWSAADALGKIGPNAAEAVPALVTALKDPEKKVRGRAALALGKIGPRAAEAVPALAEALKDQDADVRGRAAAAFEGIGPAAADAVPALAEALKDQNADVRGRAAAALEGIGPAAVPALAEALIGQDADVRSRAADALRGIGPAAADAVPALAKALIDQDADVRSRAADALRGIGPAAVPALAKALKYQDIDWARQEDVRGRAAAALRGIGPAAVPVLAKALKDRNPDVRSRVVYELWAIGPAAADAVPALAEALKDQNADVRLRAADALRRIGPAAVDAVPALAEALKDQNADVRGRAADALKSIRQKF